MIYLVYKGRKYYLSSAGEGAFGSPVGSPIDTAAFGFVAKLKKRLVGHPSDYSSKVFKIIKEGIAANFEKGRGGGLGWPRLRKFTYVLRAIKGYPISTKYPVLRRTGALERGFHKSNFEFTKVGDDKVAFTIFNDVPHAAIQNDGGTTVAELVKLKSQYGKKHYSVLVNPGEQVQTAKKYKQQDNAVRKQVTVTIPPRPFAFISEEMAEKLRSGVMIRYAQKEIESL